MTQFSFLMIVLKLSKINIFLHLYIFMHWFSLFGFDVFYDLMEAKYENKELKKRVIITTDAKGGRLRKLVKEKGLL